MKSFSEDHPTDPCYLYQAKLWGTASCGPFVKLSQLDFNEYEYVWSTLEHLNRVVRDAGYGRKVLKSALPKLMSCPNRRQLLKVFHYNVSQKTGQQCRHWTYLMLVEKLLRLQMAGDLAPPRCIITVVDFTAPPKLPILDSESVLPPFTKPREYVRCIPGVSIADDPLLAELLAENASGSRPLLNLDTASHRPTCQLADGGPPDRPLAKRKQEAIRGKKKKESVEGNDAKESTDAPEKKKGRGRGPGATRQRVEKAAGIEEAKGADVKELEAAGKGKGRGGPRKAGDERDSEAAEKKKGRGRPRKAADDVAAAGAASHQAETSAAPVLLQQGLKRPRGRPRKAMVNTAAASAASPGPDKGGAPLPGRENAIHQTSSDAPQEAPPKLIPAIKRTRAVLAKATVKSASEKKEMECVEQQTGGVQQTSEDPMQLGKKFRRQAFKSPMIRG